MRALLLLVALVAAVSFVSATTYIEQQTFDGTGATPTDFYCKGAISANTTLYTAGECKFGFNYFCDSTYFYQVSYSAADKGACYWGNATSVTRTKLSCGFFNGNVQYACKNSTDGPNLPSLPSGWTDFVRSSNMNNSFDPNQPSYNQYKHFASQDCSVTNYYSETARAPAPTCTQLQGTLSGYSTDASFTCDNSGNYYKKTYDNDKCTGNVVSVGFTPFKASDAKCGANGIQTPAVTSCTQNFPQSQPSTPSYAANGGNLYAVMTSYNDNDCKAANLTNQVWYSDKCSQGGNTKYVCTNTTQYPVLVKVNYNLATDLCDGGNTSNDTQTLGCSNGITTGSTQWQCVAGGSNGPNSAASISVSFAAIFIAAFVAMVSRQ